MNRNEQAIFDALTAQGYRVLRRGWPDFLCYHRSTMKGIGVELKCGADKLSDEQIEMHETLRALGLPVFICRDGLDGAAAMEGRKLLFRTTRANLIGKMRALENQLAEMRNELNRSSVLLEDPEFILTQDVLRRAVRNPVKLEAAGRVG